MSFQIKVARTETNTPLSLILTDSQGPVSGATVVVAIRDGDTTNSYLDFADNTFKISGWTTRQAAMTASNPGVYVKTGGQSIALMTNLPVTTENLIAEYEVTAPTQSKGITSDIILLDASLTIANVQTALDNQGYSAARAGNLDNLDTTVSSVNTAISALNNLSSTDVQTALTNQGYTVGRAPNLDNLDATISSIATLIGALNDLSIADVQTAMTNQGYTSARAVFLDNLDAAITSVTAAIAALQDLSIADVQTALTNQGLTVARAGNLDNLDATISSIATLLAPLATMDTRLLLGLKVLINRFETDPVLGTATVYDDDDVTPLLSGPLWKDVAGTIPYSGSGAERRDRLT